MDIKLIELIRSSMADIRQSESTAQEIVALLDEETKTKLYNLLSLKIIAALRAQKGKLEEAIARYGS